ncbi:Adenylate cyclase, class 3 [Halopseudomonas formosensis]|uniref:Adenylate cyclase, class 3 n=1 Tax=Halopseudomonas formosensis TaxID=1002526 RepID=A0A1I6B2I3_9GAMM|nr:adenylate/guanylate cyclase domain-containing protein [Halopseudomonas formosensis]SFQ75140.1 Adenylate cyclase, class 3 [Halopseudomonas formosensis]
MNLDTRTQPVRPPLEGYYSRVMAYLCVALVFAALAREQGLTPITGGAVLYALIYPHLMRLIARWRNKGQRSQFNLVLLALDAVHTGVFITLCQFSMVPSLVFLLLISFTAIIIGGPLYLFSALLLALTGTMLSAALLTPEPQFASSPLLAFCSLAGGGIFTVVMAMFIYRQGRHLEQAQEVISAEQEKAATLASNLAKYLSPQVWESIFSGNQKVTLETRRKKLTVFFSDIRGFTELAEEMEAEALTDLLNNYLNEMSRIALQYGGTIDKFIGDSMMVFFGDPVSRGAKQDAEAAVSMAIAMRKHMKVLRQQWRSQGITKPLEIRMGLSTGYCTVGNFGADMRMDYTIIGREVNLASRLESAAEAGEILISHETWSLTKDLVMCRDKGQLNVKGFSRPLQIYQVVGLRRDLGAAPTFVEHELPGFSMYLDTNGIRNYDKDEIVKALELAARKLRDKVII